MNAFIVYTICCQLEVAGDVDSGENVKTIKGYAALNFEVASFSSLRDIFKNHMVTAAMVEADIDNSIKQKCIRVSLSKTQIQPMKTIFQLK